MNLLPDRSTHAGATCLYFNSLTLVRARSRLMFSIQMMVEERQQPPYRRNISLILNRQHFAEGYTASETQGYHTGCCRTPITCHGAKWAQS